MSAIIKKGMPEKEYRDAPFLSVSQVKSFAGSETPWHYYKRNICPNRPIEFNPHFETGRILHSRVELGDRFEQEFVIAPKGIRRDGPTWQQFVNESGGKTPVRRADWELTEAMYKNIMNHSGARELLSVGEHEESFFGEYNGIPIKGRTDFRKPGSHIVDVKSAKSGCPWTHEGYFGPSSFRQAIIKGRLHWQAAFYDHLAREAMGITTTHEFIFIAIEKTYPFDVSLFVLSPRLLDRGYNEVFPKLEELSKRIKDNDWPRYGNKIYTIEDD